MEWEKDEEKWPVEDWEEILDWEKDEEQKGKDEWYKKKKVVIGCGECLVLSVDDIPLCLPAKQFKTKKYPAIMDVTICTDVVMVNAIVRKIIYFKDFLGIIRTKVHNIPVDCCIKIPGAKPGDKVAKHNIIIKCDKEELRNKGFTLHEKMCVEISITLERLKYFKPC